MKTLAPEFSALIIILRSTGPRDLDAAVLQVGGRRRDGEVGRRAHELRALPPALVTCSEQPLALGIQLAVQPIDERERLARQDFLGYANCASSVEPWSASVDESLDTACITWSKYPAPTSRWCLVAVYPSSSRANSRSCSST